jgi:hypothetical protein
VHPQVGHRARRKLEQLGFLASEQITCRKGRGGTGTALRLTDAGYKRLDKRPRQPRGGDGVQHRWLVMTVARAFNTEPDITVGGKPIDILIPYNDTNCEQLDAIITAAHPLTTTPTMTDAAVIAIEIETDFRATAENNARKNYDQAHASITIIAVLKDTLGAVAHLTEKLPAPVQDRTLVIDAFDVIELARGAPSPTRAKNNSTKNSRASSRHSSCQNP